MDKVFPRQLHSSAVLEILLISQLASSYIYTVIAVSGIERKSGCFLTVFGL